MINKIRDILIIVGFFNYWQFVKGYQLKNAGGIIIKIVDEKTEQMDTTPREAFSLLHHQLA